MTGNMFENLQRNTDNRNTQSTTLATTDIWPLVNLIKEPLHHKKPVFWQVRGAQKDEASLSEGVMIEHNFPDLHGVLLTAYNDFNCFLKTMEISQFPEAPFLIIIQKADTPCYESYRLVITMHKCLLEADDLEGIRRGLVALEEEILKLAAPLLRCGTIERYPVICTRLSRCFFGPIKRPPFNRDELDDNIDYYPDEYLNRLAHEGVNALWITITFRDTVPSRLLPYFGRKASVHIPKLQKTVQQCARYGIKVYVFFIEPIAFIDERNHPGYSDINLYKSNYPELLGNQQGKLTAFCPNSKLAKNYLYEAAHTLFTLVPGLGGMIDITVGERLTHCWSGRTENNNCPRCSSREPNDVLTEVLSCFRDGMHDANPDANFISWPYGQSDDWGLEETIEAAGSVPSGVILQHNFECGGSTVQLGRERLASDYWLAYPGPSDRFVAYSKKTNEQRTSLYAKIQVGCAHELASVSHIPVPGILYDKYKAMHELGVSGAMQGWYFGNYPSLMTRAAGRLSFAPIPADRSSFVLDYARIDWGPYAPVVTQAWEFFRQAYTQCPINIVFSLYGPLHDGPVWPLYLKPVNKPLIPNWKFMPEFPVHGDRIGECMWDSHTYDETLVLCDRMVVGWRKGLQLLQPLIAIFKDDQDRKLELNCSRAIGLLLESGVDILRFYYFREALADTTSTKALLILGWLRGIVNRELEISEQLAQLCQHDPALGYNSEHEGYRFTSDKLHERVKQLHVLLNNDFPEIEDRVTNNLSPFPEYIGQNSDRPSYRCCQVESREFSLFDNWDTITEYVKLTSLNSCDEVPATFFKACHDDNNLFIQILTDDPSSPIVLQFFPNRLWPDRTYDLNITNGSAHLRRVWIHEPLHCPVSLETRTSISADTSSITVRIPLHELGCPEENLLRPLRVNIKQANRNPLCWISRPPIAARLLQSHTNPDDFGWFVFE